MLEPEARGNPVLTHFVCPFEYAPRVGRNQPCPCGSGRKSKKCCGK